MTSIVNDRLIKALLKQPVDKTPVWIMRQAGRYLPEYRELRQQVKSFLELCKNPELACEATLQPLRRFDLDAAILFSDILTIPDAMGLELYFTENEGPRFKKPIMMEREINKLSIPDPEQKLKYVLDTVQLVNKHLQQQLPLIGFAGSPWTLATYMIENGSSKTFSKIKGMIYQNPQVLQQLLEKLATAVTDYLNAQIRAGVNAIMLFDTWGGILSTEDYHEFSLRYMQQILAGLIKEYQQQPIPTILFTKNGGLWLETIATSGCNAIGLDWTIDIKKAKQRVGNQVALQGNLDPCVLYGDATIIRQKVKKILHSFGADSGHIFNLGHGIYPDTPFEHVKIMVDAVHEFSHLIKSENNDYSQ